LVVENDLDYRQDYDKIITAWGYQVVLADGTRQTLLEDAKRKARSHSCCIALVDMRLLDEDDISDHSGLNLISELKPTRSIVVTSYGSMSTAVEALKVKGAINFIGKEKGPLCLREAITEAAYTVCRRRLKYHWPTGYQPDQILRKLNLSPEMVSLDEPHCALKWLYNELGEGETPISQIDLQPVTTFFESPDSTTPFARSVVFVVQPQGSDGVWHQREIVKLAPSERIQDEMENYSNYVKPHLSHHRTARIENHTVVLWNIGAIRYTNIATEDRKPLRHWYHASGSNVAAIADVLEDLFLRTLGPWHELASSRSSYTIYAYYLATFKNLERKINSYPEQSEHLMIPCIPHELCNPVVWVRKHGQQSHFESRFDAITHGDLHSDNVFVDRHGQTCVIDYERSGPGYCLRDFVELEADIRLRLLPMTQAHLPLAYHLDSLLLAPRYPDQIPGWVDIPSTDGKVLAEFRKAFDVINTLRKLAFQISGFHSMKEYYWALLMETLFSVTRNYSDWENREAAALARHRATLSAALICERLADWEGPWPPAKWEAQ